MDAKDKDLVAVAKFTTVGEADVARVTLEAEGIPAFVPGENSAAVFSYMAFGMPQKGVPVLVRSEDAPRAREILDHVEPIDESVDTQDHEPTESEEESETFQETVAEVNAEAATSPSDEYAERAFRIFFWWIFFPPVILLTLYFYIKAVGAVEEHPPRDPRAFRKHLNWAMLGGIIFPLIIVAVILLGLTQGKGPLQWDVLRPGGRP
jgi:hypothetical protein